MGSRQAPFVNLADLQHMARDVVEEASYGYIAGGANDERTIAANSAAWQHWQLVHRVLRDVSDRSTRTRVLGTEVSMPVLVAPTAFHKLLHPEGEVATAKGTAAAGTVFTASTISTTRLEDIASASEGPKWYQLYVYKDRKLTEHLVERATSSGYEALVLTVDTPVLGRRERDLRSAFTLPDGITMANFEGLAQARLPAGTDSTHGFHAYVADQLDASLTWDDVDWLRDVSGLPVLVKGVVHPDDARLAVDHGCAGIIVSNHGGRQLDAGIGTAEALPAVVDAVEGHAEVFVDGGVRRGTDVLVALALGAKAVLLGRPILWALALDGAVGVERALGLIRDEIDAALALSGLRTVDEVTSELVVRSA